MFKIPLHIYDFTTWRYQLELAISMPFLLLIGYWWFTPESPRWLLSQNRSAEALQVVKSIAKWNGKSLDEEFYIHFKQMVADLSEAEGKAKGLRPDNMTAMLRFYPSTRKNFALSGILHTFILIHYFYQNWFIFTVAFNWLANAVAYNGLTFYSANLNVSPQIGFAVSALVEVPSYLLSWLAMGWVGRRRILITTMVLGGIACLSCSAVPEGKDCFHHP